MFIVRVQDSGRSDKILDVDARSRGVKARDDSIILCAKSPAAFPLFSVSSCTSSPEHATFTKDCMRTSTRAPAMLSR